MDGWLANLAGVAWSQTWQLTALIAAVWLTTRIAARNRPHLASILWLVVLLKCVMPPLWSSPSGVFCWLRHDSPAIGRYVPADGTSLASNVAATTRTGAGEGADAVVVQVQANETRHDQAISSAAGAIDSPASAALPSSLGSRLLLGGLLLWLMGSGLYLAVALARLLACWRRLRQANEVPNSALNALLRELRSKLGVRRPVRLWVTASHVGPAVIGLWHPIVIVPAALVRGRSPEDVAPLLAHELIHIRRGDLWLGLLQTLAEGLWWFHPLVRGASRMLTREAERCCDEAVIAHLNCTPATYARSLLEVLALKQQLQPVPSFPGVRPVDVTRGRLERIMQLRQGCRRRTPWWCWLVLALLAAAALPGAALMVGADEKDAVPSEQPYSTAAMNAKGIKLQSMTVEPPAAATGKLVVQTYDLVDLVEKFCTEVDERRSNARKLIEWHVERSAPGPWKTKGIRVANPQTIANTALRDRLEANEKARFEHGWVDDKLIVVHTAAGHELIERQLQILRGPDGLAQLSIEVRILSAPVIAIDRVAAHWKLIGSTPSGDELQPDEKSLASSNGLDERQSEIRGTVETVIERQRPAILALLDDQEAGLVINAAQGDARTNILQAPKVTLFNGQSARIEDTTQRPFVVGVKSSSDGGQQPQIRVVAEGTSIRLRPELTGKGKVLLDLGLTLSHIRGVETAQIPIAGQPDIRIQVPEVGITRLNSVVEMDLDQMLAIGLPDAATGKAPTGRAAPGCILVKVRRILQSEIDTAERSQAQYRHVEADSVVAESSAAEPTPPESVAANREPGLVERVYHVADLVVGFPLEPLVISLDGQSVKSSPPKVVGPDYESLMELAMQTVAPQSWAAKGGTGTIEALPNRLSVIVRQTPDVHAQVADMFTQLRRLQDLQILWTTELLKLPPVTADRLTAGPLADIARGNVQHITLAKEKVDELRKSLTSQNIWPAPKITLFNGQSLDLRFEPASDAPNLVSRLQLQSTVAYDLRLVRVLSALGNETLGAGGPLDIPRGHSLLIDVSARSAEDTASPRDRQWCLLTPKVLLMSREPYARVLSAQDSERPE